MDVNVIGRNMKIFFGTTSSSIVNFDGWNGGFIAIPQF
jgi:tetrahydromethanopterin S-methyltransferase subunit F